MLTGMTATLTEAFWPCVTDVLFRRTLGIGTTVEMTRFTTDCAGWCVRDDGFSAGVTVKAKGVLVEDVDFELTICCFISRRVCTISGVYGSEAELQTMASATWSHTCGISSDMAFIIMMSAKLLEVGTPMAYMQYTVSDILRLVFAKHSAL